MGLLIRKRIGNKALLKKSKEEIFKKDTKNTDQHITPRKLEENFVSGLDLDLNSMNRNSKNAIKFSGWCYHKNFMIKKIYLGVQDNEKPIININLPRWDVYEAQKDPNSINSGFWTIISMPKSNTDIKISLRIILENNKEFTKILGKTTKK